MNLETLISSNAIISNLEIKSKKRALETLADRLTVILEQSPDTLNHDLAGSDDNNESEGIDSIQIFQLLTEREKLGSTAMGNGVALPHARTDLVTRSLGAFLKIDKGIDFDSPDQQPTDLIFALLVPEHYTDEHLKILAQLATLFSDQAFCDTIRKASSDTDIYSSLITWQLTSQAS